MNVLAIGAHPDDIEILCGGTRALYAEQGHKVFMAVTTNGNVGTPDLSPDEIARVRHGEQQRACTVIGGELIWMNLDDEWLSNDRPAAWRKGRLPEGVYCASAITLLKRPARDRSPTCTPRGLQQSDR